ncbi:hypothetical protein F3Y22_tig00111215pilonHSYRG00057 [Hibiscus syriacus]|uniref:Uncharacterized protein n=1 Tax=Hibiscus syriacus TaxID=106335 RepID=A0A6A2YUG6_HIBSY|nr:hypothetical protein F3Y22_tig00111215pilonHSYRG00057 [Hibiscus syriacus]
MVTLCSQVLIHIVNCQNPVLVSAANPLSLMRIHMFNGHKSFCYNPSRNISQGLVMQPGLVTSVEGCVPLASEVFYILQMLVVLLLQWLKLLNLDQGAMALEWIKDPLACPSSFECIVKARLMGKIYLYLFEVTIGATTVNVLKPSHKSTLLKFDKLTYFSFHVSYRLRIELTGEGRQLRSTFTFFVQSQLQDPECSHPSEAFSDVTAEMNDSSGTINLTGDSYSHKDVISAFPLTGSLLSNFPLCYKLIMPSVAIWGDDIGICDISALKIDNGSEDYDPVPKGQEITADDGAPVSQYIGRIHLYSGIAGKDLRPVQLFENFQQEEIELENALSWTAERWEQATYYTFFGRNAKILQYFEDLFCNIGCYEEYSLRTSNSSSVSCSNYCSSSINAETNLLDVRSDSFAIAPVTPENHALNLEIRKSCQIVNHFNGDITFWGAKPFAVIAPTTAVPSASTNAETNLLDVRSDSFAIVPVTPENLATEFGNHPTFKFGNPLQLFQLLLFPLLQPMLLIGFAPTTDVPSASTNAETNLLDVRSDSFAIVSVTSENHATEFGNQGFDDPFGDDPLKLSLQLIFLMYNGAPSYAEALSGIRIPTHDERVGQTSVVAIDGAFPTASNNNHNQCWGQMPRFLNILRILFVILAATTYTVEGASETVVLNMSTVAWMALEWIKKPLACPQVLSVLSKLRIELTGEGRQLRSTFTFFVQRPDTMNLTGDSYSLHWNDDIGICDISAVKLITEAKIMIQCKRDKKSQQMMVHRCIRLNVLLKLFV